LQYSIVCAARLGVAPSTTVEEVEPHLTTVENDKLHTAPASVLVETNALPELDAQLEKFDPSTVVLPLAAV
jgi:hypothetical protein